MGAVLAVGCGGEDRGPPSGIALEDFCPALDAALADAAARCGCDADVSPTLCEDELIGAEVRAAIDDGRLVYDPGAAARLVDDLESSCDAILRTLRELSTFEGVLTGTIGAGDPCELVGPPSACAGGACIDGTCLRYVGPGDSCGEDSLCVDLDSPEPSRAVLPCVDGRCVEAFAPGEPCDGSHQCESGRCLDGSCAAKAPIGEPCASSIDCASGYCDVDTCAEGMKADGEPCVAGAQCASGYCAESGVCGPPLCRSLR